ncbi:MAG TPA: YceI family protein [Arenimonas sp.]|nr:YceI family protein [Arenimonas sp.]
MKIMHCILLFLLSGMSGLANGNDWQANKDSTLTFSSSFQTEAFTGAFKRFTPQIRFNPKKLSESRFDVAIDLSSVNSENSERDDTLKTSEFFDVKKNLKARYTATQFKHLGGNRYQANGQLFLRGITKPVALVFTWTESKGAVLNGNAVLNRLDFNVGSGDWADTEALPNAVKIQTKLILIPKPSAKPSPAQQ